MAYGEHPTCRINYDLIDQPFFVSGDGCNGGDIIFDDYVSVAIGEGQIYYDVNDDGGYDYIVDRELGVQKVGCNNADRCYFYMPHVTVGEGDRYECGNDTYDSVFLDSLGWSGMAGNLYKEGILGCAFELCSDDFKSALKPYSHNDDWYKDGLIPMSIAQGVWSFLSSGEPASSNIKIGNTSIERSYGNEGLHIYGEGKDRFMYIIHGGDLFVLAGNQVFATSYSPSCYDGGVEIYRIDESQICTVLEGHKNNSQTVTDALERISTK